jgi:hypothetical protein
MSGPADIGIPGVLQRIAMVRGITHISRSFGVLHTTIGS